MAERGYNRSGLPSYSEAISEDLRHHHQDHHELVYNEQQQNRQNRRREERGHRHRDGYTPSRSTARHTNGPDEMYDSIEDIQYQVNNDDSTYYNEKEYEQELLDYSTTHHQTRDNLAGVHGRHQPTPQDGRYMIPPAPSPLNGPYYQGKLRPEYQHMSGPYPSLFHVTTENPLPDVAGPSHGASNYSAEGRVGATVKQEGCVTRVDYGPGVGAVTYVDSPDGDYGSDYMCLSVFNTCCCFILLGAIGVILSYTVRHARDTGDARRSRCLSKATLWWNVCTILIGTIVLSLVIYYRLTY